MLMSTIEVQKITFCARVNCGIASSNGFTTAILHWYNRLQHIRGNIRALVEFTDAADGVGWVRGFWKATNAVSKPVPVANRTLVNRSLQSGLRPHEITINRTRTVRDPFDDFAGVHTATGTRTVLT